MLTDGEVGVGFEQDVFIKHITRLCHKKAHHRHEMFVANAIYTYISIMNQSIFLYLFQKCTKNLSLCSIVCFDCILLKKLNGRSRIINGKM